MDIKYYIKKDRDYFNSSVELRIKTPNQTNSTASCKSIIFNVYFNIYEFLRREND